MLKTLTLPAVQRKRPRLDRYLMRDPFGDDRAAGAINGTKPLIGNGVVVVVDTNSKFTNAGGLAVFATGAAVNDGRWWAQQTRIDGQCFIVTVVPSNTSGIINIGWDANQSGAITDAIQFAAAGVINVIPNGGTVVPVGVYTATTYTICIKLMTTGFSAFIRGGAFTNWTLLTKTAVGTANASPAIGVGSATSVFTADNAKVVARGIRAQPEAGDGFSIQATTDGLVTGNLGGADKTWTGATWTVAAGAVTNTPTQGAEIITNGNMETGSPPTGWPPSVTATASSEADERTGGSGTKSLGITNKGAGFGSCQQLNTGSSSIGAWVNFSFWAKKITASYQIYLTDGVTLSYVYQGSSLTWENKTITRRMGTANPSAIFQALDAIVGNSFRVDDVSVTPITLSTLFRSLVLSTPDVLAEVAITRTIGTQSGLVLNLDSAGTPANFIIVYMDGAGNCVVDECVAGVYTNKQTTAVTYVAGAVLRVIRSGTALRVFYNNLAVGVELTMTANTAAIHGLFSTYSANSFDNFVVYPRGTEGQWEGLNNL